MKHILQLLDDQYSKHPEKIAFSDIDLSYSWKDAWMYSQKIGTALLKFNAEKKSVLILLEKNASCVLAMFGSLAANSFYTILDSSQPIERMKEITSQLDPVAIITNENYRDIAGELTSNVIIWNELENFEIDTGILEIARRKAVDTNLAYILFTSGSTGKPKGVAITHRNILAYSEWFVNTFGINENSIIGNQTPFYFSMSVSDIYGSLRAGAKLNIIPQKYFGFPIQLLNYMVREKVNTIYWVPSALGIVTTWKALDYVKQLPPLHTIMFAGEVLPMSKYHYWHRHYPNALFANLFGPTETTDICTYYIVNHDFSDAETFPIGIPCDNCEVFVINDSGKECSVGEEGELLVAGSFIAKGYYGMPEKTAATFIQNPLHKYYPDYVYRTGDIVKYNDEGILIYCGRKDHQIKRHGYRIELGEIEAAVYTIKEISECSCIYIEEHEDLVLFYSAKSQIEDRILKELKARLPSYMIPSEIHFLKALPHNENGKISKILLSEEYQRVIDLKSLHET